MKSLYNLLMKHGQTISFGVGALLAVIYYAVAFSGMEGFNALGEDAQKTSNIFNTGLYMAYFLVAIAFIALLVFGIMRVVSDFKGSMMSIITLGVIVVLFFILYSMADPSSVSAGMLETMKEFKIDDSTYKIISASIGTAVTMLLLSVVALVWSAISNMLK